jgi:hypothetical protein
LSEESITNPQENVQYQVYRFTYEHLATLIEFLKEENPEHAELLKKCQYDPSGENIPLYLKLPFMAMEILCCECHHINDLLFSGSQ